MESLNELAQDIYDGKVFTDKHLRTPHDLEMVFIPLAFLPEHQKKELIENPPGLIYEYFQKSNTRSVNGFPCFYTVHFLNKFQTQEVFKLIGEISSKK